eukprot:3948585-Pleurochrysis_carterae.AAC.1
MISRFSRLHIRLASGACLVSSAAFAHCHLQPKASKDVPINDICAAWIAEEEADGYKPPSASWPKHPPAYSLSPELQRSLNECGGAGDSKCHGIAFDLAVALLGSAVFGHDGTGEGKTDYGPSDDDKQRGLELMRILAEQGMPEAQCALAFCLMDGDIIEPSASSAVAYHEKAAAAGLSQSMHELGVMHYLGDGVAENVSIAVRWFKSAAEAGQSGSMFLLADCLASGQGVDRDEEAAFAWLVRAGELGHRGARSRVIATLESIDRYHAAAGRKASEWTLD